MKPTRAARRESKAAEPSDSKKKRVARGEVAKGDGAGSGAGRRSGTNGTGREAGGSALFLGTCAHPKQWRTLYQSALLRPAIPPHWGKIS